MPFLGSLDEFLRILCDVAVKATVLLGLSWLVLRCLARSSAAVRHRVGSLTMIGLLLLPVLSWQLPAWQWAVLPAEATNVLPSGAPVGSFGPTVFLDSQPSEMPSPEPPAIHSPFPADSSDTLDLPIPAVTPTPVPEVQTAAPVPWLALMILGGWFAGMALCLVGLGIGLWQVRQLTQHSQPVRDNAWLTLITDLRARLRFRRPIELRESSQSIVPLTWGLIRPRVMLPAAARGWAEPMRRVVLLHELAHVQRADVAYQLLARLACAVYWFHPLAWLALKRLRQDREQACDDAVIHTGEQPSTYAEQLLEVARLYCRPNGLTLAVEMARGSSLETRLRSMFDAARSHAPLNWRTGATVLILTTSLLCLIAAIKPVERTAIAASGTGQSQETRAEQEPVTNPDQDDDGGSKLLRELRRKAAPLLKELAEKHGYDLIEGEHVKCLPPPYPPLRGESYRIGNPGVTENFLNQPSVSLLYHWKKGALTIWGMRSGDLQNPGRTVLNLCDEILGVKPQQMEGSPDLLRQGIPGDWVVRRDAPEESRLEQLNTILADKAKIPVRLEFRIVEQAVYVVEGKYKLTPLPGYAGEDRTQLEDRLSITDALHVFAQEGGQLRAGGTGDFQAFLDNLGSWVNSPIVDETTSRPVRELSWQYFGPPGPLPNESGVNDETDRVLSNVAKQTGFTFNRAIRKIRILTAEEGDLRSENRRGRETRAEQNAEQDAEQNAAKIARLRNGLTVELLGVAKPGATKPADCWNPEGGPFADLKEWPRPYSPKPERVTHDLLLKFTGLEKDQATTFESPALRQWPSYPKNGVIQRVAINSRDATFSLRVGITDVDWGPWQKVDTSGDFLDEVEVPAGYEQVYDQILPVHIELREGQTGICWENVHNQHLAEMSLVAIDKQGKSHQTYAVSLWGDSDPIHMDLFKLSIADIDHFEYRLRPYRHWVTFENISLEPGRRTKVTVKAESIPIKKEDQRSENRRGNEPHAKRSFVIGTVTDRKTQRPVIQTRQGKPLEVAYRLVGEMGEHSAQVGKNGEYLLEIPPGTRPDIVLLNSEFAFTTTPPEISDVVPEGFASPVDIQILGPRDEAR
ncbi:MAG: M56 family metallopeptidase, partial [Planctomycetales bacterium]